MPDVMHFPDKVSRMVCSSSGVYRFREFWAASLFRGGAPGFFLLRPACRASGRGCLRPFFFPADSMRGLVYSLSGRKSVPILDIFRQISCTEILFCLRCFVVVHRSRDGAGHGSLLFCKGVFDHRFPAVCGVLLLAGDDFPPVRESVESSRCEKPPLKRFLLFRGSWSFGYFWVWVLAAVTVGQAVHLLLFREWKDGWLWMDAVGCLAAFHPC